MELSTTWIRTEATDITSKHPPDTGLVLYNVNTSSETTSILQGAPTVMALVTSALSFLGAWLILYTFLTIVEVRTTGRKILVYLSFTHCFLSMGNIIGGVALIYHDEDPLKSGYVCFMAAVLVVFTSVCGALWTAALGVYIYICLVWKFLTLANKMVWVFHLLCWGIPGSLTIAAITQNVIGCELCKGKLTSYPTWWWIVHKNQLEWIYLSERGWDMVCSALIVLLFLMVSISRRRQKNNRYTDGLDDDDDTTIQVANRQLRHIPLVYVLLRMLGTVRLLLSENISNFNDGAVAPWLCLLQAFGDNAQGLVNVFVFCLCTKSVRLKLQRKFYYSQGGRRTHLRNIKSRRLPVHVTELHSKYEAAPPVPFEETMGATNLSILTSEKIPILDC